MAPLFVMAHAVEVVVRMVAGGIFPGLGADRSADRALLWPVASWILLAPQRRPRTGTATARCEELRHAQPQPGAGACEAERPW
jgi:hypothetical protein